MVSGSVRCSGMAVVNIFASLEVLGVTNYTLTMGVVSWVSDAVGIECR